MREASAPLWNVTPVVLSSAIVVVAAALMTTRVSLDLEVNARIRLRTCGLVVTGYPLGFIAGCLLVRRIVERFGHGVSFLALIVLSVAATLAFTVLHSPLAWFFLRFGSGFAMAAIFTISESWINLDSRSDNRGALFSYYMILSTLGTAVGPALVGLPLSSTGELSPCRRSSSPLPACRFLLSGRMRPATAMQEGKPQPARPLPLMVAAGGRAGLLRGGAADGHDQHALQRHGPHLCDPPWLYAGRGGRTRLRLRAGRARRTVARWLAVGPVPAPQGPCRSGTHCGGELPRHPRCWRISRPSLLFALVFVFGFSALSIYPLAVAYATSTMDQAFFVSLSSRLLLLHGVGSIIAPALSNDLMARFGPVGIVLHARYRDVLRRAVALLENSVSRIAGNPDHGNCQPASRSRLIRGGTVVLPEGPAKVDIGVRDGVIAALGGDLSAREVGGRCLGAYRAAGWYRQPLPHGPAALGGPLQRR